MRELLTCSIILRLAAGVPVLASFSSTRTYQNERQCEAFSSSVLVSGLT